MSPNERGAHLGLNQSKQDKLAELSDVKTKVIAPQAVEVRPVVGKKPTRRRTGDW